MNLENNEMRNLVETQKEELLEEVGNKLTVVEEKMSTAQSKTMESLENTVINILEHERKKQ